MKEKIINIIKELQPGIETNLDRPFDDFGLDSLDVVEIVVKVETDFGINLDDCEINKTNTINDLIKAVENDKR